METILDVNMRIKDARIMLASIDDPKQIKDHGKQLEQKINEKIAMYDAYFDNYLAFCVPIMGNHGTISRKKYLKFQDYNSFRSMEFGKRYIEEAVVDKKPVMPPDYEILKSLLREGSFSGLDMNIISCEPTEKGVKYIIESGRLPAWLKQRYNSASDIKSFEEVHRYWEELSTIACLSKNTTNATDERFETYPHSLRAEFNKKKEYYLNKYNAEMAIINAEKRNALKNRRQLEKQIKEEYNDIYDNIKFINEQIRKNNEYADKINRQVYGQNNVSDVFNFLLNKAFEVRYLSIANSIGYISEGRTLVVESILPVMSNINNVKNVKYIKSMADFKIITRSNKEIERQYEDIIYKICLKVVYDVFYYDTANVIDAVVYNGNVKSYDSYTGREIHPTVLSIHVSKKSFSDTDLSKVDPKSCFKFLKGVSANKITLSTPIVPVLTLNKDDSRFVAGMNVSEEIDESSNLAEMDWKDFEHLIRELFEREFNATGGEVRVTQASRDGGVDAVVFDPDPIRGGKIVVQAKRYTKTVDVSSVRDLYGTVLNEGANKGVIITTSDYGPDAYDFAKGKPLTLLNGGHLLHLLSKHGHKARIDIRAARIKLGLSQGVK